MTNRLLPLVSVIIPVYNDGERLSLCLKALKQQTYPSDRYEVIVVDNASDKEANIRGVVEQFEGIRTAFECQPGSYAARNCGIAIAKGEAIAFTDADCIPAPNWLEKGIDHLVSVPNCGLVAGNIEVFFHNLQQPSVVELYESILAFRPQECLELHHYGVTANVFTWKQVIDRVGMFNSLLKSNGDIEWGQRIYASGYQQVYASDAVVAHPARYSWQQLRQKTRRYAGGAYDWRHNPKYSWRERNWYFVKAIAYNLMPPVMFAINNYSDPKLPKLHHKLKVILTMMFVRYLTVYELLRLKLGGVSLRQ